MTPTQPERVDPRRVRTRRAILQATDELLSTHGVEHTTVATIAKRAGVSVGSIYAHFGSKATLILTLCEEAIEPRFRQLEAVREDASPLDRVLAVGDAYVRFAVDDAPIFRALAIRAHEPPTVDMDGNDAVAKRLHARIAKVLTQVEADLAAAMDAGTIRHAPIPIAMVGLLASWNGIADLASRRDDLAIPEDLAWRAAAMSHSLLQADIPSTRPFARPIGDLAA